MENHVGQSGCAWRKGAEGCFNARERLLAKQEGTDAFVILFGFHNGRAVARGRGASGALDGHAELPEFV